MASNELYLPSSILDTDLYKLTMQQAVLQTFPDVSSTYRFIVRDKTTFFTPKYVQRLKAVVSNFAAVQLTGEERDWLTKQCPYFSTNYIDYLWHYRFKPEQVAIVYHLSAQDSERGIVEIEISGPWVETILWEVPMLAAVSETFFQVIDTDWNYDRQEEIAYEKAKRLVEGGCAFMEFGTRRRRSFHAQDLMLKSMLKASKEVAGKGRLVGTSNVHHAHKYGIKPMGTIAHEWFMGVASLKGYEAANSIALDLWEKVFQSGSVLIALTDTFSSKVFFDDFAKDVERARRWHGLRQDSGDPFKFAKDAKAVYEQMGIDHRTKSIIFSDNLDVNKALELQKCSDELGFKCTFGIGTNLSNDFSIASTGEKSKALNIVIKLASVDGKPCVKISDDLLKNTGDKATVEHVKRLFGLPLA